MKPNIKYVNIFKVNFTHLTISTQPDAISISLVSSKQGIKYVVTVQFIYEFRAINKIFYEIYIFKLNVIG